MKPMKAHKTGPRLGSCVDRLISRGMQNVLQRKLQFWVGALSDLHLLEVFQGSGFEHSGNMALNDRDEGQCIEEVLMNLQKPTSSQSSNILRSESIWKHLSTRFRPHSIHRAIASNGVPRATMMVKGADGLVILGYLLRWAGFQVHEPGTNDQITRVLIHKGKAPISIDLRPSGWILGVLTQANDGNIGRQLMFFD